MQKTWVERACRNMALSQNRDIALWRISSLEILLLLPGKLFLLAQGLRAQEYLRPDLSAMGVCIGVCVCKRDVRVCVCVSICSHIYLHVHYMCAHTSLHVCVCIEYRCRKAAIFANTKAVLGERVQLIPLTSLSFFF